MPQSIFGQPGVLPCTNRPQFFIFFARKTLKYIYKHTYSVIHTSGTQDGVHKFFNSLKREDV